MGKAAIHRDNLVDTAVRLFRERGYSGTGLQEILNQSGAPKGSLYYYFPEGKEALAEAAVRKAGDSMYDSMAQLLVEHSDVSGFLKAYGDLLGGWMEVSGFKDGAPITTTVLETTPASERIATAAKQVYERWLSLLTPLYKTSGLSAAKARSRAELTIAAFEGALVLARVNTSKKPLISVAKQLAELA